MPGAPNMVMAANMVGLPPGMIITQSGEISMPVVVSVRRATASRVAGKPLAGV